MAARASGWEPIMTLRIDLTGRFVPTIKPFSPFMDHAEKEDCWRLLQGRELPGDQSQYDCLDHKRTLKTQKTLRRMATGRQRLKRRG